jgi:predicted permease
MMLAWTAFEAVAAIFMMMAVGAILAYRGILNETLERGLARLALDVAVPCLLFGKLMSQFDPAAYPGWWRWPLIWGVFTAATLLPSLALARLARAGFRREFALGLFYPNAIFLPFAMLRQMAGADSPLMVELILFTLFFTAFFFNTCGWFFGRRASPVRPLNRLHPSLWATLLAMLLRVTGADAGVPAFWLAGVEQIGQVAIPLVMIVIGSQLARDFRASRLFYWREVALFVALKNVLWPLLALLLFAAWRPERNVAFMIVLQCAVPPVSTIPAIVARLEGNRRLAGQMLLASFALSIVTLPLVMILFTRLFPNGEMG